jgi:hypothetical protein
VTNWLPMGARVRVGRHRAASHATGVWALREVDAQQRWEAQVAPTIVRLDQEIALHHASLDRAANRFENWQAASRAVIDCGLKWGRHAGNLAERVGAERNHLDGLPPTAEMRRTATQTEQLKAFAPASHGHPLAPRSPGIEM